MATQESITNALAAASAGTAVLVIAFALGLLFWLGIDWMLNALDLHVPVRQLVTGRSLHALSLSGRWLYWRVAGGLAPRTPAAL